MHLSILGETLIIISFFLFLYDKISKSTYDCSYVIGILFDKHVFVYTHTHIDVRNV